MNLPITVCENALNEVNILYKGRPLSYTVFQKQEKHAQVVSSKTLDHKLKTPTRPAKDNPWRRYGLGVSGKPIAEIDQYGTDINYTSVEKWTNRLSTFPHLYYAYGCLSKSGHLHFAEIQDISTLY